MPVSYWLVLAAFLFSLGVYGVLVLVLLSIELMMNAVNLNLVAFSAMFGAAGAAGQVFALFVIAVAAAEVGVGLAIVILVFRNRGTVSVDDLKFLRW